MRKATKINRGLSQANVDFLNSEYDNQESFWKSLMDDNRLFIAIRDDKLNAYRHGCSLVEISPKPHKQALECVTASKYLTKSGQVKSVDGRFDPDSLEMHTDLKDEKARASILATMRNFAGPESVGITQILKVNPTIVDVEIAIPGEKTRIDLLLAMKTDSGHELVFFEAKTLFDSRVRADQGMPEVVKQLEKYKVALAKHGESILDSYRTVITNYQALKGIPDSRAGLMGVEVNKLTLCETPHLVFVGFDRAQKREWKASQHHEKLKLALGAQFVHMEKTLLAKGKN
jgi:hypothetical protein